MWLAGWDWRVGIGRLARLRVWVWVCDWGLGLEPEARDKRGGNSYEQIKQIGCDCLRVTVMVGVEVRIRITVIVGVGVRVRVREVES